MTALGGQHVRLEPLQALHLEALISIGSDPAIWTWYPDSAATPEGLRHFVDVSLAARDAGTALPFVQIDIASGQIIGSTRFGAFDHRRSEEHTSELQSLMRISYDVFCLKKKKQQKHPTYYMPINIHINKYTSTTKQ